MRYFWRRSAVFFKRLSEWRRGFFRRFKKILGRTHRPISMALTELHGLSGSNTVGGVSSATGKVLTIRKRLGYSRNEENNILAREEGGYTAERNTTCSHQRSEEREGGILRSGKEEETKEY